MMNVTWNEPSEMNGVITHYTLKFYEKLTGTFKNSSSLKIQQKMYREFKNLKAYTKYVAKVHASTSVGDSPWSEAVEKYTDPNGRSNILLLLLNSLYQRILVIFIFN